jgi:hypothetical protein
MIYSVTVGAPRPDFAVRVQSAFPGQTYNVFDTAPATWLIYAPGMTSLQVLERIGSSKGDDGRAIVTGISGYNGFHKTDLWEWIKTRGQT